MLTIIYCIKTTAKTRMQHLNLQHALSANFRENISLAELGAVKKKRIHHEIFFYKNKLLFFSFKVFVNEDFFKKINFFLEWFLKTIEGPPCLTYRDKVKALSGLLQLLHCKWVETCFWSYVCGFSLFRRLTFCSVKKESEQTLYETRYSFRSFPDCRPQHLRALKVMFFCRDLNHCFSPKPQK